ncbi:MAG: hypothetical protein QMD66_02100 [Actinomycetota bacterium]|nr:hypothetical protein [Actinomycetota bacterium]MDI6821659.1 hypothetical protein [Actinomycetota bacterium]
MRFPYKRVTPGIIRPIIPIELSYQDISISYEVLIDSGADFCIFDAEIAEILNLPITKGVKREFAGVTGDRAFMYMHSIEMKLGGWSYQIEAGFSSDMGPYAYGIVGQVGFFDKFIVKFDYLKEEVEIKPR